jgi:hypothetical protein
VPSDETVFCLFEGQEAAVRAASDRAGVPVERVLESVRVDGNPSQTQLQAPINSVAAGCPLHLYIHD